MLFSQAEYDQQLRPLLVDEPENPDDAVALSALSVLCEPGDGLAGNLTQFISPGQLVAALISRSDAAQMAGLLGSGAVAELEDSYETEWSKIWGKAQQRWLPRLSKTDLLESLSWMHHDTEQIGARRSIVLSSAASYPEGFDDLRGHRPHALWCIGDPELLKSQHAISVVGTRNASPYGISATRDIAAVASQSGIVTVSGGAFGIDAAVHESALALGAPTIVIVSGGLANLYPKGNLKLLHGVARSGLVLAECPPPVTPAKFRFLMRNRLIAALGRATVVIEAGKTSGAISTANHALDLGRQVAVVPGNWNSARSIGCHDYLNSRLGMVQLLARAQQVRELAGLGFDAEQAVEGLGTLEKRALDTFTSSVMQAWEVQRLAGLTVKEAQIALGSLELLGLITRVGGGYLRAGGQ
ncbi:MAG: hypothetical protein RJA35_1406 [Actinomycetota bacterium]|jgi:DNA processing protein